MADRIFPEDTLNTRTLASSGLATTPEGQFSLARQTAQTTGENVLSLSAQIKALLGQYQQAGQVQQSLGIQEQVRRGTAPLPADLSGAQLSPSQILGFRRGEVGAIEPTLGGARRLVAETESAITNLKEFEQIYSSNKLKLFNLQQEQQKEIQNNAMDTWNAAQKAGSGAIEKLAQNKDFLKDLGITQEIAGGFIESKKRAEDIEEQKLKPKEQFTEPYTLSTGELVQRNTLTGEIKVISKKAEGEAPEVAKTEALDNLSLINEILENPNLKLATGKSGFLAFTPKTQLIRNQIDQLKAILDLKNRQKLKGQGTISDFEAKTLQAAGSALSRSLSDEDFVKQLKKVKGVFETASGLSSTIKVTNPKTGESKVLQSTRQGINQALKDGMRVEYQ